MTDSLTEEDVDFAPLEEGSDIVSRIMPRAHQIAALEALRDALARCSRAQANMCCGSGKTYTQAFLGRYVLEAMENPDEGILVCFVPNRALIYQNARNFRKVFESSVEYLGVCSDIDLSGMVALEDQDALLETTTDPDVIEAFLADKTKARIIICTYHSAVVLRESLRLARGEVAQVDLGLFDEAHRTAGNKTTDDLFAYGLIDQNFPMRQRAFFTATPRVIEGRAKTGISMSDPEIYGPVCYTYPFSQGIIDGNVVDYDLWVPVITRSELALFMKEHNLAAEERTGLAMIALQKVMEKTGQTRFLTYHSRIASSEAFAERLRDVLDPSTLIAHVDGNTPSAKREELMQALGEGRTILTNCKAFVEGVDAPGLQGVLFVDPRKSVIDVVQAVGRLSRPDPLDPGKRGSIIAPILAQSLDPSAIQKAADSAGFQTLIQVAQALRANDDALSEDVLERSRAMGRCDDVIEPLHNMQLVGIDDPEVDLDELAQAITVLAMRDLGDSFAQMVGRLEKYIQDYGYLPDAKSDARLHAWMVSARKKHAEGSLEAEHAALLDDVDEWMWVSERARPETIARHVSVFRDRTQSMPSSKRGKAAEADLHSYLMEAQEDFLRNGMSSGNKLTLAMMEENLLFFAEEVLGKRAHQSGCFKFSQKDGKTEIYFHPRVDAHRTTVPVFRSGHSVRPRPIRLHMGRSERERIMALGPYHSVRLTLVRAGIEKDPFKDGRILEWHGGSAQRGESQETSKNSLTWLLARLYDRKVSGRTPYSMQALKKGLIKAGKPATILNSATPRGTIGDVVNLIERVRAAKLAGKLSQDKIDALNQAPDFSWSEESDEGKTESG